MNAELRSEYSNLRISEIVFDYPEGINKPHAWIKHIPFAFFLIEMTRPKVVVELGVHTGNSFNAICQAVKKLKLSTKCYGVDTWQGDIHAGLYESNVYNELSEYVSRKYEDIASLLKMTFEEALNHFPDKSVDLLHIDGFHTYHAAKKDFETWLPKMSDRGVVILHDTMVKERDFGVWKLWVEISAKYETHNFQYGNGLGCVAFGKRVNQNVIKFLEECKGNSITDMLFERLGDTVAYIEEIKEKEHFIELIQGNFSKLFVDCGAGFRDEDSILKENKISSGLFNLKYDLSHYSDIKSLRWDPLESRWCNIRLESVSYIDGSGNEHQLDLELISSNGIFREDGWVCFETFDPMYFFPIQGKMELLSIKGKSEVLDFGYSELKIRQKDEQIRNDGQTIQQMDEQIHQMDEQIRNDGQTIQQMKQQLHCLRNSRGWKCLEVIRKILRFFKIGPHLNIVG